MWEVLSPVMAKAILKDHGVIRFLHLDDGNTSIEVDVYNFKPGKHGFHIHEKGTVELGCDSLCAHYNPFNTTHGDRTDKVRHVGDLGNIDVEEDGTCKMTFIDKLVKLKGKHSVVGRSVIIHEDEDDLGRGGNDESLKTGNSGKRITCGKINYINN